MKIKFNEMAYDAFKDQFCLQDNYVGSKLLWSLPFLSTYISVVCFHIARTDKKLNRYGKAAVITRGVLGLIPGVNLSLYLVSGLGTLTTLAIDGVRAQLNKKKPQGASSIEL